MIRRSTARTAFIGRALRGPLNRPLLIRSFGEFQHLFGGLWQPSTLSYAVEHFFDNGGREAVIVRVANGARAATITLPAGTETLKLEAVSPGTREFLRASVDYDNVPAQDARRFNLTVQRVRVPGGSHVDDQEIFGLVTLDPADPRYVGAVLARSDLVRLAGKVPRQRPNVTSHPRGSAGAAYVASGADGDDGAPLTDYDIIGSDVERTGLFALGGIDYFNLLCIPPLARDADVGPCAWLAALQYCSLRHALVIIDPPAAWHTADVALSALREFEYYSAHALMYFPHVLAHDKLRGHFESFAPSGAVAGLIARTDESNPVWSPGRPEESVLRPGYRPACLIAEDRRVRLEQKGVNTLHAVRSVARIGAKPRTLAAGTACTADAQSLAARRFALFIVTSIEQGTRWVREADASAHTALELAAEVRRFFEALHADGAFGARPLAESFFVRAMREPNVRLLVGFAGTRPGDIECYRIDYTAAGTRVRAVSFDRQRRLEFSPEENAWVERLATSFMPDR